MPTYYAVGKPVTVRHIHGIVYPVIIKNRKLTTQHVFTEGFSHAIKVRVFKTPEKANEYAQTKQVRDPGFREYVLQDPPILVIKTNAPLRLSEGRGGRTYYQGNILEDSQTIESCSVEFASRSSTILTVDMPKRTVGCVVA